MAFKLKAIAAVNGGSKQATARQFKIDENVSKLSCRRGGA